MARLRGCNLETPPQAWGRHQHQGHAVSYGGNTPTGVGKTRIRCHCRTGSWKHPHRRGEDNPLACAGATRQETPPQAWGRRALEYPRSNKERNTPTGVGKTDQASITRLDREKHPHRRGEDPCIPCRLPSGVETPPQAWGRRRCAHKRTGSDGNTPTGVGKTMTVWKTLAVREKHPHRRGED